MKKKVCLLAVIPMRKEPSDRSEMVSQILFGETMDVLDETEKWALVRLHHDQYEGWVDRKQISDHNGSTADTSTPYYVKTLFANQNIGGSNLILPAGAVLNNSQGNTSSGNTSLKEYASMFLEAPYLWGGRTFMGIDCSGFTQVVFRLAGINLMRDAYQQAEQGELISFIEETHTGDLAFFENTEGKIIHVGIVLREGQGDIKIIHASGKVRTDKLDHLGIFNEEIGAYSHSLRIIRRMVNG